MEKMIITDQNIIDGNNTIVGNQTDYIIFDNDNYWNERHETIINVKGFGELYKKIEVSNGNGNETFYHRLLTTIIDKEKQEKYSLEKRLNDEYVYTYYKNNKLLLSIIKNNDGFTIDDYFTQNNKINHETYKILSDGTYEGNIKEEYKNLTVDKLFDIYKVQTDMPIGCVYGDKEFIEGEELLDEYYNSKGITSKIRY